MIVFPKAKKKTSLSNKVNLSFWYLSNLFCFFCCFAETNCKADQFQNLKEGVDILSKLWSSIKLPIVLWNLKKKVAFNTNVDDYFLLLKILFFIVIIPTLMTCFWKVKEKTDKKNKVHHSFWFSPFSGNALRQAICIKPGKRG